MSNVTVTGNEAQFNENADFLKNVVIQGDMQIRGTLSVPPLASLTIDDLTLKNVFGNPNTTFHNKVTFLDTVTFAFLGISSDAPGLPNLTANRCFFLETGTFSNRLKSDSAIYKLKR